MKKRLLIQTILALAIGSANASIISYEFQNITSNNPISVSIGESQFSLDITDENVGANQAMFIFKNTGTEQSTISEIYFDDNPPVLMTFDGFSNLTVVDGLKFRVGASPSNLPAGRSIGFVADYAYEATNPAPRLGINPGEALGIRFNIASGSTFADVVNSMSSNQLKVGIHATNFTLGFSESFIAQPLKPVDVPEPSLAMLMFLGLSGLPLIRLFRKK
jgi:hypothetical protein